MKRILALVLSIVLLFSFSACGKKESKKGTDKSANTEAQIDLTKTFMPDRTFTEAKGIEKLDDLANTYYNLTVNKKLNVVYIGGSVTNGTGGTDGYCWRSDVTDWFKAKFPSATITDTNAGIGSSSSFWGYHRLDEYVLAKNPDLVFVEFAVNDFYNKMKDTQSAAHIEAIIRKIRSNNANTDIVIVLVGEKSHLTSDSVYINTHKKVADFYGIPSINVFESLKAAVKSGKSWESLVTDIVHPNNDGYKIYANAIEKVLEEKLITSPKKVSALKGHSVPKDYFVTNPIKASRIIYAEEIAKAGISGHTVVDNIQYGETLVPMLHKKAIKAAAGSIYEFTFEGIGIGLLAKAADGPAANVTITLDGEEVEYVNPQRSSFTHEFLTFDNLTPKEHTVKIEVTKGTLALGGILIAE